MAQKNNLVISAVSIFFVFCLLWMGVFFFVPYNSIKTRPVIPSENERFSTLQRAYERRLEGAIKSLLIPLVGQGKVQVAVQIKLNLRNARHNIQASTPQREDITTSHTTWEKEIQNAVQQQHISVIVDGSTKGSNHIYQARTPQEMNLYKKLIQSVTGYNPNRGDTLVIQNAPFVSPAPSQQMPWSTLLLATLIFCFGLLIIVLACSHTKTTDSYQTNGVSSMTILDQIALNPTRAIAVIKNWIYMPSNAKSTDWTSLQKIGIILLALDEKLVRQILISLDDHEVRQIAKTMVTLGVIPPQESMRILTELYNAMENGSAVVGNPTRVQQILSESTNEQTLRFKETLQPAHLSLWEELASLDTTSLATQLSNLKTEISAYILYHLRPEKASQILENLPEAKASQILIHLSHIGHISDTTNAKMEQEALKVVQEILNSPRMPSGSEKTTEILSHLSQTENGQSIIKDLNAKEPLLARKLTAKLIRFDDIAQWPNAAIQILLRNTLKATATTALANAPSAVKKAIQRNVPLTTWQQLETDIQSIQKSLPTDKIHQAQKQMVETAQMLLTQGKIKL